MINLIDKPTLDDAKLAALNESADSSGTVMMVSIFKQGDRQFLSAVFQLGFIVHNIKMRPLKKEKGIAFGVDDVELAMNRPLDADHAKATKEYLTRNYTGKYILPAMTLNIQGGLNVYTTVARTSVKPGYLILPMGVTFTITDGQHRKAALDLLYEDLSTEEFNKISTDGIPVMISTEDVVSQIHQDFSDCSKTKQLPQSLIAVYDRRNPANALVMDLITHCPIFKGKVDAASSTLSKNSTKLFLVSQVRSLIKELFLGNSSIGDVDLEKRAYEQYNSKPDVYKQDIEKYIKYINMLTEKIDILNKVSKMQDGVQMTFVPEYRSEYLVLNSAGMNILGRIGHIIIKNKNNYYKDMDAFIDKLAKIDWKKNSPLWKGNIVQDGSAKSTLRINSSNSSIKTAIQKVKTEIGMIETENAPELFSEAQ